MSMTVTIGLSSKWSGAPWIRFIAAVTFGQSESRSFPLRMRLESTFPSEQSSRFVSWSFDISKEKNRAGRRLSMAALAATFSAQAVLPVPGRPPTTTRSEGCSPLSWRSKSWKPVGTPVISSPRL